MSLSNVRKCCQSKSKITQQYNQHQQTQRNTINRQLAPAMGTETRLYSLPLPRAQKPGYNKTWLSLILSCHFHKEQSPLNSVWRGLKDHPGSPQSYVKVLLLVVIDCTTHLDSLSPSETCKQTESSNRLTDSDFNKQQDRQKRWYLLKPYLQFTAL